MMSSVDNKRRRLDPPVFGCTNPSIYIHPSLGGQKSQVEKVAKKLSDLGMRVCTHPDGPSHHVDYATFTSLNEGQKMSPLNLWLQEKFKSFKWARKLQAMDPEEVDYRIILDIIKNKDISLLIKRRSSFCNRESSDTSTSSTESTNCQMSQTDRKQGKNQGWIPWNKSICKYTHGVRSGGNCEANAKVVNGLKEVAAARLIESELFKNPEKRISEKSYLKAATILKMQPVPITKQNFMDVCHLLPHISNKATHQIEHILFRGRPDLDEKLSCIAELKSVYGIGPCTAHTLYNQGARSVKDLQQGNFEGLSNFASLGLKYYDDLQTPVTQFEAHSIKAIVDRISMDLVSFQYSEVDSAEGSKSDTMWIS
eukprot:m.286247 g.286247  ORF g.286247 m.286247 type:complete len:368 (+) comp16349_c0_seq10:261-1364(+)